MLTRLFYVNLTAGRERGNLTLKSVIKGKTITLTLSVVAQILGLPSSTSYDYPPRAQYVRLAKDQFLLPNSSTLQPSQSSLTLEARIVFTILVRCVLPRSKCRDLLTT